jgi:hypothetical protein
MMDRRVTRAVNVQREERGKLVSVSLLLKITNSI